jgi:flagellar hook-associated protein 1 FlgK
MYGTVSVEVQRYVNRSIYDTSIISAAKSTGADVVAAGFERLAALQGGEDFSLSPASLLSDLKQAIELAAASPADNSTLTSMVNKAKTVASSLNGYAREVQSMRAAADKNIAASVDNVNDLLAQLKDVNDQIIRGTRTGADVLDSIDMRDQVLSKLSSEIGIKVLPRENNDVVVISDNGLMLFENIPRKVTFQPTPVYGPNTTGGVVRIDGVPVNGPGVSMPISNGRIAGNLELRDKVLVQEQRQLDEIARSLVDLFAEEDQSAGGGKPKTAGLFTWSGGPGVPASGLLEPGIALSIKVNPLVDPQSGGNPALVRDGAINGDADYKYNSGGGTGFSDRLYGLSSAFETAASFDAQAGLPVSQSVLGYAKSSLDWLNGGRQSAIESKNYKNELASHYKEMLQNETGPNLDFEMARLLEVERTYQASAKLMAAVDELFTTLMNSVR